MTYSFSGLLNVKRPNIMPTAHLKQIPTDVNISCSISRNLVGGKCVPKFTTLQSVLVLLNLRAIPEQRLHMKIPELGSMLFKLYDDLKDWFPPGFENEYCSGGASAELHASAETKLSSDSYVDVINIDYNIPLLILQPIEMDAFFNDFLESFQSEKLDVYLDKRTFLTFRIYIIERYKPPDSLEIHKTGLHNRLRSNFGEQPVSYNASIVGIESTPIPDLTRNTTDTYNMHPYQITSLEKIDDSKVSIKLSYPLFDHSDFCFEFQSQVLEFKHLIDCPLVNISRSNSSWITLQNGNVKMEVGYEISSDCYYMSGPDSIAICLNSYKNFTAYLQQMSGQVLKYSPEVIVTITCIGLSILCLLMSLAAYTAFPKLRHPLPVRNSMTLVSTHLAAQSFNQDDRREKQFQMETIFPVPQLCLFYVSNLCVCKCRCLSGQGLRIRIKRSPSVQKNVKNERSDLEIFVKLSPITGMTWIFGLINSFTQISFFSYLFIVLNASQGVFLFFAFICNRRVYSMLMNLVYGTPELSTTGNTMSTTAS
ncbi:hypothetical protein MAR_029921 [Mya arenaria]|uniref:Uncharacterized protein n=1 Tax=Mya arenaria TaxID=6604 RepID=A0ABY7DHR6_MYAAR|nr:hypothetical protein MAR_029921 [Mya arenaria]